ncbi:MAG: carbon-nitrogen hydrolase family protein [Desulfococcaceae bacterium]
MKRSLELALAHVAVRYREPERNRAALLGLFRRAAREGAELVLGPEMSISGYSFDGPADLEPFAEPEEGPTVTAVAALAREFGLFACVGLAEIDLHTDILYNSVFVLAPDGRRVLRYRKISAESRWACPGDPMEDNTFETPWGRIGVLICSDAYYGLMPRVTALRGADLLLSPATWPPLGLDPRELWRVRARENGIFLAACNRTGRDRTMDCRDSVSLVADPQGRLLGEGRDADSRVFRVSIPLNENGRLDDRNRRARMADRRTGHFRDCYRNLAPIQDRTSYFGLPAPGPLSVRCVVPKAGEHPVAALSRGAAHERAEGEVFFVLPAVALSDAAANELAGRARRGRFGILVRSPEGEGERHFLFHRGEVRVWELTRWPHGDEGRFPEFDVGAARIASVPFAALVHPEIAVALAKRGCDMVAASETEFSPADRPMAGVRTTEKIAVAVCGGTGGGVWIPPEGHERWAESLAGPGETAREVLNTRRSRQGAFQDRIDFSTLLARAT